MNGAILEKLGLSKAEIETYITLLKIGSGAASKISEKTGLNRTHVYDTLTKLIEKGFVSSFESNNIKYFQAASPNIIKGYVQEIERNLTPVIEELKKISPENKTNAKIQLFSGKEGLKSILKDIINTKENYVVFGEEAQFQTIFPIYITQFLRDIKANGMMERLLVREGVKVIKNKNSEVRFLKKEYSSPTTTAVYGDKVATFIWTLPYNATLIHDQEVADSFRSYFNLLWKSAKR